MASSDVFSAIERIRTDETFARRVAEEGATALVPFHLDSGEQTAIVLAFQQDLDDAFGQYDEVVGFGSFSFGGLQLTNLIAVQRNLGGSDTATPGEVGWDRNMGWIERSMPGAGSV